MSPPFSLSYGLKQMGKNLQNPLDCIVTQFIVQLPENTFPNEIFSRIFLIPHFQAYRSTNKVIFHFSFCSDTSVIFFIHESPLITLFC